MISISVKKPQFFFQADGIGSGNPLGNAGPLQSNAIRKRVLSEQQEKVLKGILQSNVNAVPGGEYQKRLAEIKKLEEFFKSLVIGERKEELDKLGITASTKSWAEMACLISSGNPKSNVTLSMSQEGRIILRQSISFSRSQWPTCAALAIEPLNCGKGAPEPHAVQYSQDLQEGDKAFLSLKNICNEFLNFLPAGKQG
ncbi:MAG: hypothetical protein WCT52_05980 [Candidatus Micrarchaeia archaeon]|jgi:hypothetical protein